MSGLPLGRTLAGGLICLCLLAVRSSPHGPGEDSRGQWGWTAQSSVQMFWPVVHAQTITQPFGPTSLALEPPYDGYAHFHTGVDLAAPSGTPVCAAASGVAHVARELGASGAYVGYGLYVWIDHGQGWVSLYGHLSAVSVVDGQWVHTGQMIGRVGSTGWSTGPHLHFELRYHGDPVDPVIFYPALVKLTATGTPSGR